MRSAREILLPPDWASLNSFWIDSSAVYAGTYAALGSGMHPVEFPVELMEQRCGKCHGRKVKGQRIGRGMYFQFGPVGPALPEVEGETVICGTVTVPENYNEPEAGQIDLAFAVLRSSSSNSGVPSPSPTGGGV